MPSKMRSSEGIAFEANTDIVFNTTASSAAPKEQKNYLAPMPLDYVVGKPPFLEITAPGLAADTGEVGKWEPKRHLDYQVRRLGGRVGRDEWRDWSKAKRGGVISGNTEIDAPSHLSLCRPRLFDAAAKLRVRPRL